MKASEVFEMEKKLLEGCHEAIESDRDMTEEEGIIYRAYSKVQDLRKYLDKKEKENV